MKNKDNFHLYQHRMHQFILNHPFAALWVSMGLGKTITTLTAISDLLDWCEVSKPLIIAPRLVAEKTWSDEIEEWEHVSHLRVSKIIGNAKQRQKAITAEADIWVISRDNIAWLVDLCGEFWPFDMVIIDESTSFKSHSSLRFRKLKQAMKYVSRMVQLTGTPVPNGLLDLWAPTFLLDKGERLGTTFTGYRNRYFEGNDYTHRYVARKGASEAIHAKLSDICISMKKEDWLYMKPIQEVVRKVDLPNMDEYIKFREEAVLEILEGEGEITALNAGALYSKLLQFSNGAVYDQDHKYHLVHEAKLDMLEEIIESLDGEPVIVFYSFQSDIERITKRIKNVQTLTKNKKAAEVMDAWNRGEVEVLLAHPASAGHGLNLQKGGHHIIWFGIPDPLELYQQAIGRLDRQGQTESVVNIQIIAKGTLEEKVAARLIDKTLTQDSLVDMFRAFTEDASAYKKQLLPKPEPAFDDWLFS